MFGYSYDVENYWKVNFCLIVGSLVVWVLVFYGFVILFCFVFVGIFIGGIDFGFWFV